MSLPSARRLGQLSVLVVDDNRVIQQTLCELLRSLNISRLSRADNGKQAIKSLTNAPADIIFADWRMPVMNGETFVRWVRQSPASPNPTVPIVLVTAANAREDIEAARDVGVSEFLIKPVTGKAVEKRLEAALNLPRKFIDTQAYVGPCRRRSRGGGYFGPLRRADDHEVLDATDEELRLFRRQGGEEIRRLIAFFTDVDITQAEAVHQGCLKLESLGEFAKAHGDPHVARLAKLTAAYGTHVRRLRDGDKEVMLITVKALAKIISLPANDASRGEVVEMLRERISNRLAVRRARS